MRQCLSYHNVVSFQFQNCHSVLEARGPKTQGWVISGEAVPSTKLKCTRAGMFPKNLSRPAVLSRGKLLAPRGHFWLQTNTVNIRNWTIFLPTSQRGMYSMYLMTESSNSITFLVAIRTTDTFVGFQRAIRVLTCLCPVISQGLVTRVS